MMTYVSYNLHSHLYRGVLYGLLKGILGVLAETHMIIDVMGMWSQPYLGQEHVRGWA